MSLPNASPISLTRLPRKNTASSVPAHLRGLDEESDSIQSSLVGSQLSNNTESLNGSGTRVVFTVPQTVVPTTKSERAFSKLMSKFLKTHEFKKKYK